MLRTLFVIILFAIGVGYSVRGAFYAMLFYLWMAYFRPDTWIWGSWVIQGNLSFVVGVYAVIATLFSKERFRFGLGQGLMLLFLVHSTLSVFLSPVGGEVVNLWPRWTDFARVVVVGLIMVTLITTEARLRLTLIVIGVSLAFEGAKQGWTTLILHPGAVNENSSPFMGDNNGVAVGMLMLVPILTGLAATSSQKLVKNAFRFLAVGVLYRAISTYSRGGFLAALAIGLHALVRSKRKVVTIIAVVAIAAILVPVLPDAFWNRMGSIQTAAEATDEKELDSSQASRLHFWRVAVIMANDRPLVGVGFNAYNDIYDKYDFRGGEFGVRRSVHSAWFGLLAEVGYVGLIIFIVLIARSFFINWRARRLAKSRPDLANLVVYATSLEAALVAFAVGGSFVPYQYNEMVWHVIALTIVVDRLIREKLASSDAVLAPARSSLGGTLSPIPGGAFKGLRAPGRG